MNCKTQFLTIVDSTIGAVTGIVLLCFFGRQAHQLFERAPYLGVIILISLVAFALRGLVNSFRLTAKGKWLLSGFILVFWSLTFAGAFHSDLFAYSQLVNALLIPKIAVVVLVLSLGIVFPIFVHLIACKVLKRFQLSNSLSSHNPT